MSGQARQYLACIVCQLSVLVAGAAYTWFEPLTERLTEAPNSLSEDQVSWVVSNIEIGVIFVTLLAGELANRIGRKIVILSAGPLCFLGWIILIFFRSFVMLNVVRFIHGFVIGVVFTVTPIYIAEVAEPQLRGRLSGVFQITWHIGNLYSFILGPYLNYNNFVYVCLPLPVLFTILYYFFPETPYYHLMRGRTEEAKRALIWFRSSENVEAEFYSIKAAVEEEMNNTSSWRTLFFDKAERKAFVTVQIVSVGRFMTGLAVVVSYAGDAFSRSGSFLPPVVLSIILGVLLIVIAVISAFFSDWMGRKPLLLVSCFGCFIAHGLTGAYYYLDEKTDIDSTPYIWLMYFGIMFYCIFINIGLGPLMQTLQAEMFGARTRGLACGLTQLFAGPLTFVTLKSYTPINEAFGVYLNFWLYGIIALICGILLKWLMRETAGKAIGRIDMNVNKLV